MNLKSIHQLALTLPGFASPISSPFPTPEGLNSNFTNLSSIISGLLTIAFYVAVFMAFFWLVWGAFQYLVSRGNKEELARARSRIIWALVGLVVIMLAYTISKYVSEILRPSIGGVPF